LGEMCIRDRCSTSILGFAPSTSNALRPRCDYESHAPTPGISYSNPQNAHRVASQLLLYEYEHCSAGTYNVALVMSYL